MDIIEIREILYDSVKYPSEDWMKVIILGFMSLISLIGILTEFNPFTLLFLIIVPLPLGYLFRILKTTFKGSDGLPDLNKWKNMYLDGIRVIIVAFIYAVPVIAISLFLFFDQITSLITVNLSIFTLWGILTGSIIQIIVFIIIGLIEFIAIANIALYEGEISAAFRFGEIIRRISMIGWRKYVISYAIIWGLGLITVLISLLAFTLVIGIIIVPLIIAPYFVILNTRLLALIFASSES